MAKPELKNGAKRKRTIAWLYGRAMQKQVRDRVESLSGETAAELLRSVPQASVGVDDIRLHLSLTEEPDTMFDLRRAAIDQLATELRRRLPGLLITTEDQSLTVYSLPKASNGPLANRERQTYEKPKRAGAGRARVQLKVEV